MAEADMRNSVDNPSLLIASNAPIRIKIRKIKVSLFAVFGSSFVFLEKYVRYFVMSRSMIIAITTINSNVMR